MIATWIGGLFTVHFPTIDVKLIVTMALACFILAIIVAFLAKRTLGSATESPINL